MTTSDPGATPENDPDQLNSTPGEATDFDLVVERALSRRGFLGGVLVTGSAVGLLGTGLVGGRRDESGGSGVRASHFDFGSLSADTDFRLRVPAEYVDPPQVLLRWGDPLFADAVGDFNHATGVTLARSDRVFGENNDGMESFEHEGRQLLGINHESPNLRVNLPASGGAIRSPDDVRKLQNLQGVSVVEVRETEQGWSVVLDSPFNRRVTQSTPMRLVGPAAGHALLRTAADPTGTRALGTLNNCGTGKTPWGTLLTCEENVNYYFGPVGAAGGADEGDSLVRAGYRRYGFGTSYQAYSYHRFDERFDLTVTPNEPHRFGWVVEIDPTDPESTPVKHTGLGRFKHENAEVVLAEDGRVVVYMGDDGRGEFVYKFVSEGRYEPGGSTVDLLDVGTLYAARFGDDGTGTWLPLTPATTGMEQAEILLFTRTAGSRVGATTMDRPEWVAVHPDACAVYCCLTNNRGRALRPNRGGDPTPVNAANPREGNRYGQVVRWFPHGGDHAAATFDWDLYVLAGNPAVHDDANAGSPNVTPDNMFNSPDGLAVDRWGRLWIQTDGVDSDDGDFAGMGNNQMLVGDPESGELARFLTGPRGCEVTGLCWSADGRTMFVGIQHPGGSWPDGEGLPRSSVVAVKRRDGGEIG